MYTCLCICVRVLYIYMCVYNCVSFAVWLCAGVHYSDTKACPEAALVCKEALRILRGHEPVPYVDKSLFEQLEDCCGCRSIDIGSTEVAYYQFLWAKMILLNASFHQHIDQVFKHLPGVVIHHAGIKSPGRAHPKAHARRTALKKTRARGTCCALCKSSFIVYPSVCGISTQRRNTLHT